MLKAKWILGWMLLGVMALGCRNGVTPRNKRHDRNPQQATTSKSVVELHHRVVGGHFGPAKSKRKPNRAAVGMKAPDFELPAYHNGKFTKVKLSDYHGKWLLICFYPGDFTFV